MESLGGEGKGAPGEGSGGGVSQHSRVFVGLAEGAEAVASTRADGMTSVCDWYRKSGDDKSGGSVCLGLRAFAGGPFSSSSGGSDDDRRSE